MSDPYDFFATPRAVSPDATPGEVPPQTAPPIAAPGGYGAPAYPAAPAGYGASQQAWTNAAAAVPLHGAPAYGYPGTARSPRPGTTLAAAVLTFVQAGFMLLGAALFAIGGTAFSRSNDTGGYLDGLGNIFIFVGLVLAVFGALFTWLGVRLLKGAFWSAVVISVFQGLALLGTFQALARGEIFNVLLSGAMPAAILICLWTTQSRTWLSRN